MDETEVFATEAADVAMEGIKNGVARIKTDWDTVYKQTLKDIQQTRDAMDLLMKEGFINKPDMKLLEDAAQKAIQAVS
jgi:malate dehydrogenase (oxaloacetate-decarboxylating)